MPDPTNARGRSTGVVTNNAADTDPDPGCLLGIEINDKTGNSIQVELLGLNNVPIPAYAANILLFGQVGGPGGPITDMSKQPSLAIRRNYIGSNTSVYTSVIFGTWNVRVRSVWGDMSIPPGQINAGNFVTLDFYDQKGGVASSKLGWFAKYGGSGDSWNPNSISPNDVAMVIGRTNEVGAAFPSGGYQNAWIVTPLTGGSQSLVQITSGGPGQFYLANLYGNGIALAPTQTNVPVTQMNIASGQTIPTGTYAIATRVHGEWFIQVPTWM